MERARKCASCRAAIFRIQIQWGRSRMEHILIIDDDPGFRTLLETILRDTGYDVTAGATAADARRLGTSSNYQLALTDLKLPDGDGLDVLRFFQTHAPEVPVI